MNKTMLPDKSPRAEPDRRWETSSDGFWASRARAFLVGGMNVPGLNNWLDYIL